MLINLKTPDSFPNNLPILLALYAGLSTLSFIFALFITEMIISGPGAAQIIGLAAAVVMGLAAAALAFAAGLAVSALCRIFWRQKPVSEKTQFQLRRTLISVVLLAAVAGCGTTIWQEFRQRPRTLYTSGIINKMQRLDVPEARRTESSFVLTIYKAEKDTTVPVSWNGKRVLFTDKKNDILLLNHTNREIIKIDMSSYSYVSRIRALTLRLQPGSREDLAVLAELGPASDRSMLLVYNPEYQLIYEELLRRTKRDSSLYSVPDPAGNNDLLVVDVDVPLIYACPAGQQH
jgi:hypothetical protein